MPSDLFENSYVISEAMNYYLIKKKNHIFLYKISSLPIIFIWNSSFRGDLYCLKWLQPPVPLSHLFGKGRRSHPQWSEVYMFVNKKELKVGHSKCECLQNKFCTLIDHLLITFHNKSLFDILKEKLKT